VSRYFKEPLTRLEQKLRPSHATRS
jgi:hypothetical protein